MSLTPPRLVDSKVVPRLFHCGPAELMKANIFLGAINLKVSCLGVFDWYFDLQSKYYRHSFLKVHQPIHSMNFTLPNTLLVTTVVTVRMVSVWFIDFFLSFIDLIYLDLSFKAIYSLSYCRKPMLTNLPCSLTVDKLM